MSKVKDVPGNAIASFGAVERHMQMTGAALEELPRTFERLAELYDTEVRGISIRVGEVVGDEWLLTLRADIEGRPHVTFHAATTPGELFRGLVARLRNGSVKWKEDSYAT